MDNRSDGLWQGGPWEQPARPFSPPPAVVIPPQKYRPPRPPQRRHSGRIGFLIALALIVSLTALAVLFNGGLAPRSADPVPSGSDPGYSSWEQEEDLSAPPSIPQAETGTGVILSITPPSGEALTYTQVYEKAAPSIAALTAYSAGMVSTGTGIVLTADGYIVTNAHIIAGAEQVNVTLSDDSLWSAQLVGFEPLEDLAVLKIDASGLTPAQFGDDTLLRSGDPVSAIGNPMGYRSTITPGIVSALDQPVSVEGTTMYLLQTSAAINYGSSGGALLNDRGQVVGVTTIKIVTEDGRDVTEQFLRGTAEALRLCDLYHCKAALLKERSPSCGSGQIYDGTFTHTLTEGDGLMAQMLKKKGVEVYGESQLEELINDRPFFFSI